VRGVAAPREVDVRPAPLVVIVKARNVRPHSVHGRHLEGRCRRRKPDVHRRHPVAALTDEPRQERRASFRDGFLEHGLRETVDLDDQEPTPIGHRRRAQTQPAHQTIEGALKTEDQVVEGHVPLL
jgi:hypothetical protein